MTLAEVLADQETVRRYVAIVKRMERGPSTYARIVAVATIHRGRKSHAIIHEPTDLITSIATEEIPHA